MQYPFHLTEELHRKPFFHKLSTKSPKLREQTLPDLKISLFTGLRDAIPTMKGGDKSSRAQILKKASEYIQYKRRKNSSNQSDMDDLKRQNDHLEAQIRALERAKNVGTFGKSVAELLNDEGLLAEGESLPTPNDLEPSVSGARAVAPGQSLLLNNSENVDPPRKKTKQF